MRLLGISKAMVCQTYGLRAGRLSRNDGYHDNDENDEDNSDSYKQGVGTGLAEITETTEMPGWKPRVSLSNVTCFQLGGIWVTELAAIFENKRNNGNNRSSGINHGAERTLATTLIVGI